MPCNMPIRMLLNVIDDIAPIKVSKKNGRQNHLEKINSSSEYER